MTAALTITCGFSFATSMEQIDKGIDRIGAFLKKIA